MCARPSVHPPGDGARRVWYILSSLPRLGPAPGIFSPPCRDWVPLRAYSLLPVTIGSLSTAAWGRVPHPVISPPCSILLTSSSIRRSSSTSSMLLIDSTTLAGTSPFASISFSKLRTSDASPAGGVG
eukprot:1191092-Prorocentrum_minimum.AAC.1